MTKDLSSECIVGETECTCRPCTPASFGLPVECRTARSGLQRVLHLFDMARGLDSGTGSSKRLRQCRVLLAPTAISGSISAFLQISTFFSLKETRVGQQALRVQPFGQRLDLQQNRSIAPIRALEEENVKLASFHPSRFIREEERRRAVT